MLRAALRSITAHRLRLGLTALAIILGVSFVAGTFIFTDSLKKSFDSLFNQRGPDIVVEPVDTQAGNGGGGGGPGVDSQRWMPESVIAKVAAVQGVSLAEGYVSSRSAVVLGIDGKPIGGQGAGAAGRSWLDPVMNPLSIADGRAPQAAGEVALDRATAEKTGASIGGKVSLAPPRVTDGQTVVPMTLVGILDDSITATFGGGTLTVMTLPDAQKLLLGPGRLSSVRAVAAAGVTQDQLAAAVGESIGKGFTITTGQQQRDRTAQRIQDQLQFLNTFLLVFALIALFVASFLIYNTFSMLVAQRTRELALLRAIGASRTQVQSTVLVEAFVISVIASTIGLFVGLGLALVLRALFSAFGATLPGGALVIAPRTILATYIVGVVVTMLCAWFPARRAGRVPPVAAMRDDVALPARSLRVRAVVAVLLLVVAAFLAFRAVGLGDTDGERAAQLVGFSALCGVIAAIAAAAFLARPVLGVLGAGFRGAIGRLARENGRRNPRRTAATSTALTIGIALMAALSVIAASATASVAKVVDDTIGADYVVFGAGFRPFPTQVFDSIRDTPGLGLATYVRQSVAQADGSKARTPVTGIQPDALTKVLNLTFTSGSLSSVGLGSVLVDTDLAKTNNYKVGQDIGLTLPNGRTTLRVVGIYEPAALYRGYIVSMPTLSSIGSLEQDSAVYLLLAPDADPAVVRAELERRLAAYPTVTLQDQVELKNAVSDQVNSLLGFLFALLALAVVIAILGIINTLLLSVVERTREIGLIRAVGATRAQVRRMIVLESLLIAVFGAVVGVVVGVVYGVLLQRVLASQGISVLSIPWVRIAALVLVAAVGGVAAALWPARRAARLDVLRAISVE